MSRRSRRRLQAPSPERLEEAGEFLREARRRRNLSQSAVAKRANYANHQTVLYWEMGQLPWRDRLKVLWLIYAYKLFREEAKHVMGLMGYSQLLTDPEWDEHGNPMAGVQPISIDESRISHEPGHTEALTENANDQLLGRPKLADVFIPQSERRQVTVVLGNIVDLSTLSERLAPNDLKGVLERYQESCNQIINSFEGRIEEQRDDSILFCFGYPLAHDDDARRAVSAGVELVEAIGEINESELNAQFELRVSIHTGIVMTEGLLSTASATLGETRNIASALQAFTVPGTVMISEDTYELIEGYFTCQELEPVTLGGGTQGTSIYQVLDQGAYLTRPEAAAVAGSMTPLVDRKVELETLLNSWARVEQGNGQVVLINGAPGIGKSRLLQEVKERLSGEPCTILECRCNELYQQSALYPIISLLRDIFGIHDYDSSNVALSKLEEFLAENYPRHQSLLQFFTSLLSLPNPDNSPPPNLPPAQWREKAFGAILTLLLEVAERRPVLLVMEDLHWADPSTLELLQLIVEQVPTTRILNLLTFRPEFPPPSWGFRSYVTPISLKSLTEDDELQMVNFLANGKSLPSEIYEQLVAKTDGIPLFIEELTKLVMESEELQEMDDHFENRSSFTIPTALRGGLTARLDRLSNAKGLAQIGAAIGRSFSYNLIKATSSLEHDPLQKGLNQLIDAELVYPSGVPPNASYIFKHALIQEQAYELLPERTRMEYNQRIAETLEQKFPEVVESQPELLARHFTEARKEANAIPYWQQAGLRAIERSANIEAINHLSRGLELLLRLDDSPERDQQELLLQVFLGVPLTLTKGWAAPEVGKAYNRAHELSERVGDSPHLFPTLVGVLTYFLVRGEFSKARDIAIKNLEVAQRIGESELIMEAHHDCGSTLFYLGDYEQSLGYMEQVVQAYDIEKHRSHSIVYGKDPAAVALNHAAVALWVMGYPDQGMERINKALNLGQTLGHAFTQGWSHSTAAILYQLRGEVEALDAQADASISLAMEQGFPNWLAYGLIHKGWARAQQGEAKESIEQMLEGLGIWRSTGAELAQTYVLALLADAYAIAGQFDDALRIVDEGISLSSQNGEMWWRAELFRLKGKFLHRQGQPEQTEAERNLLESLEIARKQKAKSFELRSAMDLVRIWQSEGNSVKGLNLLNPIYKSFTEGDDTRDLKDARSLIGELSTTNQ